MSRDPELRLADIAEAVRRVRRYTQDMTLETFAADTKTQDAVIRQFEIIGEAVKALPPELLLKEPAIPWREIAGFRDVLIHSYFGVDLAVLWDAASRQAPDLEDAIQRLSS